MTNILKPYSKVFKQFLLNLIQLICSPAHGWEDMETEEVNAYSAECRSALKKTAEASDEDETAPEKAPKKPTAEEATAKFAGWLLARNRRIFTYCFIPAIGVCALSWFVRVAYDTGGIGSSIASQMLGEVQHAIVTFVGLMLSAALSLSIFQTFMPRILDRHTIEWDVWRGQIINVVMYSFTFLGMVTLISNVVKVRIALLEFLPFYVLFILWKGCRYLQIPPHAAGTYMILAAVCTLGIPYLLTFLLNAVANM